MKYIDDTHKRHVMNEISLYESSDFSRDDLLRIKGGRKIIVVFSTFGEREAALIHDKIRLIRSELAACIDGILVSHRRAGSGEDATERRAREAWEKTEVLVCDSFRVPDMGDEKGKGADMRRALYHLNTELRGQADPRDIVVVFLDADVLPEYFGAHFVLALGGAVLGGHDFARASFWRALGRIKKFVAQPLFSVIDHPDIRKITGFHYPLSGEVAGTLDFFNSVHFWQRYGVETGINIDTCMGSWRVADVNLGLYDHAHHGDLDIQKMAFGIIRAYMMQLRDYGIIRLADNAAISDTFRVSFIDDKGGRQELEFELDEKKYPPLKELL
jgi:glucosyl-3-phosphoglycerate synthase